MTQTAERLLNDCRSEKLENIFRKTKVTLALEQSPNILQILTAAKFTSQIEERLPNGLFKCNDVRCLLCHHYIQECSYFYTSNNYRWEIKEHITCHSKCTIYFLKCRFGNITTYTGETNVLRLRMNTHISDCRTGNTTDRFDLHVHNCRKKHNDKEEPFLDCSARRNVNYLREISPQ